MGLGKKERRIYYRDLQASFPLYQFETWNSQLALKLKKVLEARVPTDSYVAVYQARPREASLSSIFSMPYHFCFPRVLNPNGQMEFRWVENALSFADFVPGSFGILEPKQKCPIVEKSEMYAGFIPLLAFDGSGGRLGQGKGFYDRFLEQFQGLKVGVAFEWQFSPAPIPTDAHDSPLDLVVTEFMVREFARLIL